MSEATTLKAEEFIPMEEFTPIEGNSIRELVENALQLFPTASYIYIHDHIRGLSLSVPTLPYEEQKGQRLVPFEGRSSGYVKSHRAILLRLDAYPKTLFDYAVLTPLGKLIDDEPMGERDKLRVYLKMGGKQVIYKTFKIQQTGGIEGILSEIPNKVATARENDDRWKPLRQYPMRLTPLLIESHLGHRNVELNLDEPDHMERWGRMWFTYREYLVKKPTESYDKMDLVIGSMGINVSSMNVQARPFLYR